MDINSDRRSLTALTSQPEFPGYANVREGAGEAEPIDDNPAEATLNRRKFLALSAAIGAAALSGCRRPDLQILPYSAIPDEQIGHLAPGRPTFYATCLPRAGGALPVLVESHDGRPTKIEGNPRHPATQGSTDIFAQATVFDLYSPDRVMSDNYPGVMERGTPRRWADFDNFARSLAEKYAKSKGEGFYVLTEQVPSPSLRLMREHIKNAMPKASWHTYEPVDTSEALKGAEIAFGQKLVAKYNFANIDRILALDSDFLGFDPDAVLNSRAFGARRKMPAAITDKGLNPDNSIVLEINEKGQVWLPPATPEGDRDTLDNPVQVDNYLKRRAEAEKKKTGKPAPEAIVFVLLDPKTPQEKSDAILGACRRAGYSKFEISHISPTMNRLYAVESTYTVTGTMADHRLRLPASQIGGLLLAIVRELKTSHATKLRKDAVIPDNLPEPGAQYPEKWVKAVARDLAEHVGKSAVVVGFRQPALIHTLAHLVNGALGAFRSEGDKPAPVELRPAPAELTDKGIRELTRDMADGKVRTLLVIGGNPVFNAPADANFKAELQKVATKIRLGLFFDQTSEECDWHLPLAHSLESWGDSEASDGTLCCVQPLISPLNGNKTPGAETEPPPRGGRTALEVLALLTQYASPADSKVVNSFFAAQKAAYATVRKVFSVRSGIETADKTFDTEFNRYKQLGFLPADKDKDIRKPLPVKVKTDEVAKALAAYKPPSPLSKESLEVTFHPDSTIHDGRFAMNPWLQELPDPITKLVWDNAAIISPKTAEEFALKHGERVKLRVNGTTLDIPVYILPGQADYSVALAYGQYGEMRIDRVPDGGGTDVYPARKLDAMHTATGCKLEKTGRTADLVMTQEHSIIPEGRDIIRDMTFAAYAELLKSSHVAKPQHIDPFEHVVGADHIEILSNDPNHPQEKPTPPKIGLPPSGHFTEQQLQLGFQGGYGNPQQPKAPVREKQERFPLDLARPELLDSQFQWGMVIDLSACTGCTACTIACQTENNIPVVGKQEVKRNRELHWIRIDRYFSSNGEVADADPRIVTQPVACMHCETAPCEQVCPVNAAVHSLEGLNLQVYNRCIGTRYCANACPYKVRRFNWFDFNKRGLNELRTPTPFAEGGASVSTNLLPESLRMQKNPDVTVRMRGVMEKCTYCIQRIERGKQGAKLAAADVANGRRVIEIDGAFKPEGEATLYRKPKDPKAAGYDLDRQGRVIVPDGLIVTACQAACPTQAITFGNVLDPASKVYKAKLRAGEYLLLGELNTKPRTSFLPRVRNVNPEMA
jgi:molybdopterin-containing oxidoreductase family iron-sulfur binding subunit